MDFAFSRLRFDMRGIGTMPRDVSIRAARFDYDLKASAEITERQEPGARP